MFREKFILLILFTLLINVISAQNTQMAYYVKATGNDENNGRSEEQPLKTISRAIKMAIAGPIKNIIILGSLNEIIEIENSGKTEIYIYGKNNVNDRDKARLTKGGVTIKGNSNIKLENIIISGGNKSGYYDGKGGGLNILEGAHVILINVIIQNNKAVQGGGINIGGGTCIMYGGEVSNNIATIETNYNSHAGAGVFVSGTFTLEGGIIKNNKAERGEGGGVAIYSGNFIMNGGEIIDNQSPQGGGGISVAGQCIIKINNGIISRNKSLYSDGGGICSWSFLEIINSEISNNNAGYSGGGISCHTINISNSIIKDNIAKKEGGGFNIGMHGGKSIIFNCEIYGNKAEMGAGLFLKNSNLPNAINTLILQNVVIKKNNASFVGGGAYVQKPNILHFQSGSITENIADLVGGGIYLEEKSNFEKTGGTALNNTTNTGEGVDIYQQ